MITAAEVMELDPVARLAYWIKERERIRTKKEAGHPRPWTEDEILRKYRFCNVHREDDRVTKWLKKHWRDPHSADPHLAHAMIVARYINWPPTLQLCKYPEPWPERKVHFRKMLMALQEQGEKVFTGAYIVSTNGVNIGKVGYVLDLFDRSWKAPMLIHETLEETYEQLMHIKGIGSFMSAQIIADLKYTPILECAPDWKDWAAPGPGSLRGLSRVRGLGTGSVWHKRAFIPELLKLRRELKPLTKIAEGLHLQDLQNCLCEYDKYCRVLFGQGKPRSTYTPASYRP